MSGKTDNLCVRLFRHFHQEIEQMLGTAFCIRIVHNDDLAFNFVSGKIAIIRNRLEIKKTQSKKESLLEIRKENSKALHPPPSRNQDE